MNRETAIVMLVFLVATSAVAGYQILNSDPPAGDKPCPLGDNIVFIMAASLAIGVIASAIYVKIRLAFRRTEPPIRTLYTRRRHDRRSV